VIIGGSIEELELKKVTEKVKQELDGLKGLGLDEDDTLLRITENLRVLFSFLFLFFRRSSNTFFVFIYVFGLVLVLVWIWR
jgi:hypothetical protein